MRDLPKMQHGRTPGRGCYLPLRLLLCLFLLSNPLQGIAAGTHAPGDQVVQSAAAHPCHGMAAMDVGLPDRAMPECPHCAGEGPAVACLCCDLGATSVPPLIPATPARQEGGPVTVLGRLPDALPLSPGERRFRPPIAAV